jgi:ABC-type transport system substrate-binding protein
VALAVQPCSWCFPRHDERCNAFETETLLSSLSRHVESGCPRTRRRLGSRGSGAEAGREKVDDSTVRLKLKGPNASILQILALRDVPVISKEWVEAGHDYRREYNGTGAFKMVKAVRGEQYQLARYEKYWKAGLPYLDALEFRVISDPFTRADGVRAGEIDLADFLPWQEGEAFEKNPKLQTVKAWSVFNAIILNPKRKPFDDVRVRQALAYAIDRDTTNQIGHGGLGLPITGGLLQQGGQWHCPANDGFYTYQPEKAKQLLAAAGYAKGVVFDLTLANFPPYLESWAVVSENLKTAGAFYGRAHDFKDEELDALFAKGRATSVGEERAKIYCELERQALDLG